MNPLLDAAIREAYASVPDRMVYYDTLELNHPSFTDPVRVVNSYDPLTVTDPDLGTLTFQPCAFRFKLPEVKPNTVPELVVEIDNVSREIGRALHDAVYNSTDPITLLYRNYADDGTAQAVFAFPYPMVLKSVTIDKYRVQGKAAFPDLVNRQFPNETYSLARFPGLARQ